MISTNLNRGVVIEAAVNLPGDVNNEDPRGNENQEREKDRLFVVERDVHRSQQSCVRRIAENR